MFFYLQKPYVDDRNIAFPIELIWKNDTRDVLRLHEKFRDVANCSIVSGNATLFWHDTWNNN